MNILYESQFTEVAMDTNQILIFRWKPESENMNSEQYQHEVLEYAKVLYEKRPKNTITDLRELHFIVLPELQDWAKDEVFKDGIITEKSAFLVSPDFFVYVSVEQSLEEIDEKTHIKDEVIQYFETEEEAYKWLTT